MSDTNDPRAMEKAEGDRDEVEESLAQEERPEHGHEADDRRDGDDG